MGMTEGEMLAVAASTRALGECMGATGKALIEVINIIERELPHLRPQLDSILEELMRDLGAAALLLPE